MNHCNGTNLSSFFHKVIGEIYFDLNRIIRNGEYKMEIRLDKASKDSYRSQNKQYTLLLINIFL